MIALGTFTALFGVILWCFGFQTENVYVFIAGTGFNTTGLIMIGIATATHEIKQEIRNQHGSKTTTQSVNGS